MKRWVSAMLLAVVAGCAGKSSQAPLSESRIGHEQRAVARFNAGDLAEAADSFAQAARLAELAGDQRAAYDNHLDLGVTSMHLEDFAGAERSIRNAVDVARREAWLDLERRALLQLARVRYRSGDLDGAQRLYSDVLDRSDQAAGIADRATALNGLLLCALARDDLQSAQRWLTAAESLQSRVGPARRAATLHNRATLLLRLGDFAAAERAARAALALDRTRGDAPAIAADLELLGWIRTRQGAADDAERHLRQARRLYGHLGMTSAVDRIADHLDRAGD